MLIYETYHAGAITKIGVWNSNTGMYVTVYEGVAQDIQESRIFEPRIRVTTGDRYITKCGITITFVFASQRTPFLSNRIRLDLDGSVANSWCEIDAVKVTGWRS